MSTPCTSLVLFDPAFIGTTWTAIADKAEREFIEELINLRNAMLATTEAVKAATEYVNDFAFK